MKLSTSIAILFFLYSSLAADMSTPIGAECKMDNACETQCCYSGTCDYITNCYRSKLPGDVCESNQQCQYLCCGQDTKVCQAEKCMYADPSTATIAMSVIFSNFFLMAVCSLLVFVCYKNQVGYVKPSVQVDSFRNPNPNLDYQAPHFQEEKKE